MLIAQGVKQSKAGRSYCSPDDVTCANFKYVHAATIGESPGDDYQRPVLSNSAVSITKRREVNAPSIRNHSVQGLNML